MESESGMNRQEEGDVDGESFFLIYIGDLR
jgi:hypothetical protein